MGGSKLVGALVRTTSVGAIAMCMAVPAAAQVVGGGDDTNAPATNAQPGAENAPRTAQDGATTATPASDGVAGDDIVVTGIRASLNRAIDIKRNSNGIVDAISAEDIGKFPDTNLAESLQRVTGVSINRVNGEGSEVTARGFGGGFNLVTLNGRQLPATNLQGVGGDQSVDFTTATGRSFDFGNLASEGVSTLEVYKTGRAAIPTGGIGATINVITRKPLDSRESGFTGSIGAKASYDTSIEKDEDGLAKVTPEVSGLLSWKNENDTFGVSLFGSYQKRNSAAASSTSNAWNIRNIDTPGDIFGNSTVINNRPPAGSLIAFPNDARYHFSESERERINGSAVVQFRPVESLLLTADVLWAQNRQNEARQDQTNWLNRPFGTVTFDKSPVPTAVFISQAVPDPKDTGYEQQYRASKDKLEEYGLNAAWDVTDTFKLIADVQHSKSQALPDGPNGASSTLFSMGANVVNGQSIDWTNGFPKINETINDCRGPTVNGVQGRVLGNCNNQLDAGDLGTQVGRTNTARQTQTIDQAQLGLGWDLGEGSKVEFGGSYIDSKVRSVRTQTTQTLGDWSIGVPGEVAARAGDLIKTFCLVCKFDKFDPGVTGPGLNAFRGNAVDLYNVFSPYYASQGKAVSAGSANDDSIQEKIASVYGQFTWKGQIANRDATLVVGARYEVTKVRAFSLVNGPSAIVWTSDNDFNVPGSATITPISGSGSYDNLLPAMDFQISPVENVITRVSFGRTIARPTYGQLFISQTAGAGSRATLFGGLPNGSSGNPNLKPLISDNFDVSAEWYFKPSSYVSAGFFDKRVRNFVGSGLTNGNLFGLRDATTGAAGSRSGTARTALTRLGLDQSDINLFSYTARLVQNGGDVGRTDADIRANSTGTGVNQAYFDTLTRDVDITPDANDPLANFSITTPINNRDAEIYGAEFAGQFFFGETGIGVAASYTLVRGNVSIDVLAAPTVDQFALLGLSDSANASLIYDKHGISARLTYNWRDKYLSETGRGGTTDRNPVFFAPYGTLDVNLSWDVNQHIAVSLEGINLTSEAVRSYGRSENQTFFAQENKPRLLLGARYRF
jgi:TonB-dependent receptor